MTNDRKFRILLLNALTRPLSALTLALTIIVSALTGWWWFLPIGLAFYTFMVWSSLQDKQESAQVLAEELYPKRKIDLGKLQSPYKEAVQRALASRTRIEGAVATTSSENIRRSLTETLDEVQHVTETVFDIALKAQDLQGSLGHIDMSPVRGEIQQLEYQVKYAKDDYLRNQYTSTLEAKRQQLQNMQEANSALLRWQAQLDNALATLDTIYSQVLKIKSAEVRNLSASTDELSQSLKDQVQELQITSDALDQIYGSTGQTQTGR